VHNYAKKYEFGGAAGKGGGYAAQTASSQKKRLAMQGGNDGMGSPGIGNAGDLFLFEKWNAFKKNLKKEFDIVAQMH
jgi:hypothetical protein